MTYSPLSKEEELVWLQSLDKTDRAKFLALLSHNLTVAVRILCRSDENAEQSLEWVYRLNEAHHRVAGYLMHYHSSDEDTRWLKTVVELVLAINDPVVLQQTEQAWLYSRKLITNRDTL